VEGLTLAYGRFVVQQDLTFTVAPGEIFVVMGASGGGKTTLLRHMIGLQRPIRGDVVYDGRSFWEADEETREAMQRRFGVLYQGGALLTSMTLGENVDCRSGSSPTSAPRRSPRSSRSSSRWWAWRASRSSTPRSSPAA
jgi:ABC-type transporter Mla maintaining outer membrane lipid asymmetry ATPase subunit MlaF